MEEETNIPSNVPSKKKQSVLGIGIVLFIALIIVVVAFFWMQSKGEKIVEDTPIAETSAVMEEESADEDVMVSDSEVMMDEDEAEVDSDVTTKGGLLIDGGLVLSGEVLAGATSRVVNFNQTDYQTALDSDNLIVLYFYASWCPICRAETQEALYPAFRELDNPNIVGFRVNFNDPDTDDAEKELAREFGVAYQHTKVFVKNGSRILKSPEQWDKDRYFEEIEKNI